jgi:hypothetical protein
MEEQMLTRMTLIVPAILATWLATICLTVQASRAADDCLARPNAAPPPGAHWYYRLDRATHRQCWYLAAEGARVVQPRMRQQAARQGAPKTIPQVIEQAAAETAMSDPRTLFSGRHADAVGDDAPATLATRWSGFANSAVSIQPTPASMSSSYAQEQPTTVAEDEMPLVWPILTPEEVAQGTKAPQAATSIWQLAASFSAALGFAALLVHAFLRLASARKRARGSAHDQCRAQLWPRTARNTIGATSIRSVETETSVQRLLHDLQRRQQEYYSEQPQRTVRAAMA